MAIPQGYQKGSGGWYKTDDKSGPYTINSAGVAVLIAGSGGSGGGSSTPAVLTPGTNKSGALTAANQAQELAAQNTSRISLLIQNISAADLWVSETGTAVIGAAGSFRIQPNQAFAVATNRAISIIGTVVGQAWTATET